MFIARHTVIPSVRGFKGLDRALATKQDVVFLLEGELLQLQSIVDSVRRAGKRVFLHLDMVKGIKDDEAAVHYLSKVIRVDGILSTRTSSLLHAKKYGLAAIQRGFLIDSHSMRTIIHTASQVKPDYLELMPSFAHPKLAEVRKETGVELIVGGFIEQEADLAALFAAGAQAVSTSRSGLWTYEYKS